jgi:hypothetical protein
MKFKKIVGFGDSWIWGDELLDPALVNHPQAHPFLSENSAYREDHCFLGLLGKHYGVLVENFGIPGGSLQSTIWTYLWWLEHEQLDPTECLILVGHTGSFRTSFYNPDHISYKDDPPWNRFIHSAWLHTDFIKMKPDWSSMVKQHTVLTQCPELCKLNYCQNVEFFKGQHYILGKNILQFCTIEPPMLYHATNLIWPDRALTYLVKEKQYLAPLGHPNEQGHEFLRDLLINEIDRVILA